MGSSVSRVFQSVLGRKRDIKLMMVGLDSSGKTTMLYKMKLGEIITTIPTIGMNVESVFYKNINLTAIDVGGRGMIRPLMRHYYQSTNGIIFCVDANDRERIEEAAIELEKMLREDELRGVPVLIFANKQDLPNVMPLAEFTDKMSLHKVRDRQWHVQPSSFPSGDGLLEGLDWLSNTIAKSFEVEYPSDGIWSRLFSWGKKESTPAATNAVTETPPPQSGAVNA
eukprot:TRINITY_DN790_c0_g1_i1.p1 TRINITY_DN790_c0_g1~~TRINITY_DN790_c0_g1_i1.p1  ORF type:complete len:225 (-),score=39.56 TRINITY_DN790_c0_g1_i1:58-732(-)